MDWSQLLTACISLVVGASGIAVIYQAFIRPRVYRALRRYSTVRIFSKPETERIERVLRAEGVPETFAEVEWWNQGKRAAEGIAIELQTPGPISHWNLDPKPDDIAAAWQCVHDPRKSEEKDRVRIVQKRLMPGARSYLVVGYNSLDGTSAEPVVKAFLHDRAIASPESAAHLMSTVAMLSLFPVALGPAYVLGKLADRRWGHPSPQVGIAIAVGFVLGVLFVYLLDKFLTAWIAPGAPSWEKRVGPKSKS